MRQHRKHSTSREYDPTSIGGCVLYMPFYKYGAECKKTYDLSGKGNHGTISGARPATYPLVNGEELVSNGGMETGDPPTDFSAANTPETFSRSAVQKHSGSYAAYINDSTPSQGGFHRTSSMTSKAYARYKFSFWYYLVSGVMQVYASDGVTGLGNTMYSTTGSWQYGEIFVIPTTTNLDIYFINNSPSVAASFYIDEVSVREVTGYESLGWEFDGVDDTVSCAPASTPLDFGMSSFSILMWTYINIPLIAANSRILNRRNVQAYELYFVNSNSGQVYAYLVDSNSNTFNGPILTLQDLRWQCLAMVANRSSNLILPYLNGVHQSDQSIAAITGNISPEITLYLNSYGGASNFGVSKLGEVAIFKRALSETEIKSYYEQTRGRYGV